VELKRLANGRVKFLDDDDAFFDTMPFWQKTMIVRGLCRKVAGTAVTCDP
jgi:hypothetical protein